MADDALAKAEWALRNEIIAACCDDGCELSRKSCDGCRVKLLEKAVPYIARAVLEAAGYGRLQAVAEAAKQYLERCHRDGCVPMAEELRYQEAEERAVR